MNEACSGRDMVSRELSGCLPAPSLVIGVSQPSFTAVYLVDWFLCVVVPIRVY